MAVYAVRKGSESNERLLGRYKKQVQETSYLKNLREKLRYRKRLTKRAARLRALKRTENRATNQKQKFYSNI